MNRTPVATPSAGLLWGLAGVVAFSFTVIATRVAVEQLDPLFVGALRAVVAAALAGVVLAVTRAPLPRGRQWLRLAVVAGGVVVGFPILTSFALTTVTASHSAVVIALLPAATAIVAVVRAKERPPIAFWVMAGVGAVAAVVFAVIGTGGAGGLAPADLLLFAAVIAAAIGYAEGGLLARELGAWQTISWALVLAAVPMAALAVTSAAITPVAADPLHWLAFAYLAVVSMFLGFVAWYRGLAIGPMTRVSQLQLIQPVLSLVWAALMLGEVLTVPTVVGGLAVIGCAATAVLIRQRPRRPRRSPRRGATA